MITIYVLFYLLFNREKSQSIQIHHTIRPKVSNEENLHVFCKIHPRIMTKELIISSAAIATNAICCLMYAGSSKMSWLQTV